jgi:hypothetical protein
MLRTYVDAVGAAKTWINGRTDTLVGEGNPLQKGAEAKPLDGAATACYAYLSVVGTTHFGGAENPDTAARLSAQVYGPNTRSVALAASALADEITTELAGRWADVPGARMYVADDVDGPSDQPDGNLPREVVDFTVILTPIGQ